MAELKASIQIRAEDRSSAALDKAARGSKKLEERLAGMRGELAALDKKDASIKKFRTLKAELGRTESALGRAKARMADLGCQMAAAEAPTAKLRKEFDASRKNSRELAASHRKQREHLHSLRSELRKASVDTRSLGDAQRRVRADLDRSTRDMERMGQAAMRVPAAQKRLDRSAQRVTSASLLSGELDRVGRGLLRFGLAPVAGMRAVERSKGDLRSLGMSRQEVDLVARRGRGLSRRVAGVTTPAFTAAAYDIRSGISGLDAAGVARYAELASLAAAATRADPGQMTSLFATGYGSFKESLFEGMSDIDFAEMFAAQLAQSVEAFKTDGSKMQQAIESMGSGLAEAGVSLGQQLAALGMLQQKMAPGRAGTAMAAVERTAADAQDRFREMGLGARVLDAAGNMRSPAELLDEMERVFGKEYTSRIGSQIQKAFGSEGAVQFFKALWGRAEELDAAARAQVASAELGSRLVEAMVERAQDNSDSRFERLEQRWLALAEEVGDAMKPQLDWTSDMLHAGMDGAEAWVKRHPDATGWGSTAVAAAGGAVVIGGPALLAAAAGKWALDKLGMRRLTKTLRDPGGSLRDLLRGTGWRSLPGRAWESLKGLPRGTKIRGTIGAVLSAATLASTLRNDELSGRQKTDAIVTDTGGSIIGGIIGAIGAGKLAGGIIDSDSGRRPGEESLVGPPVPEGLLRAEAGSGEPLRVTLGTGEILGLWTIERISSTGSFFLPGGAPRKAEFRLRMAYDGADGDDGRVGFLGGDTAVAALPELAAVPQPLPSELALELPPELAGSLPADLPEGLADGRSGPFGAVLSALAEDRSPSAGAVNRLRY